MTDPDAEPKPDDAPEEEGSASAEELEEQTLGHRNLSGWAKWLTAGIAFTWAMFQLSLPLFSKLDLLFPKLHLPELNSDQVRTVHLAFAILLVFLNFPAMRKDRLRGRLPFLHDKKKLPIIDIAIGLIAAGVTLYLIIDYRGISERLGRPLLPRDLIIGVCLLALLLEAARRAFGPTLSVVALVFIVYAFLAERMPWLLAARSISVRRLLSQLTLSTEGVYGVPLHVSASTVFLFVLLGVVLEKTGGGRYFVQLAFSLLGRFRGGPAKAAVCASGLTGMISGSSIANVVTTGTFTIPLMKKSGYPAEKAAAIEVAASTNGQLMPPIMGAAAFIIAEYCEMPYLQVVKAAFIPAVVSYLALIYITHLEACKLGLKGLPKDEIPKFMEVLPTGIHYLIPVGLLIVLLVKGFSPSMCVFYTIPLLIVSVLIHDGITAGRQGKNIFRALSKTMRTVIGSFAAGGRSMMGVAVACATAGIIVGVVGLGFGQRITEIVRTLSFNNIILILVLTAIASLIIGMGLPTTATYIVMASLTATVIVELAGKANFVVPLIAAHLFCFFFGILADDTPPVGLAAYAGAAVAKSDPIKTGIQGFIYDLRTAILPFIFVFNTDLLLWNITSWWHAGIVFVGTTVAMFAFAALTQNYVLVKNRWYEAVLLILCTAISLRPQLPGVMLGKIGIDVTSGMGSLVAHKFTWYLIGAGIFALVHILQRARRKASSVSV